ncbi:GNAT family N-acetyltransferase [Mycolicibacterium nivoides]|uniref:GNAT family N-acetyltransferase n=1 Tax=Mycolicibacterium nivoides TaxID=2487344 RepID=A0ABW9L9D3_9MYCO|nr:GNAT family N-acetyltransferase [Mycolicibacterium boenickei]
MDPESAQRNANRFHVRPMVRSDWHWICGWFRDPELDRRLGPIDEEWLEHVLSEHDGVQLVLEDHKGRPAALVGCVWDPTGDEHAITDLAVAPQLRRSGIGREAVAATVAWAGHPAAKRWIAFVEVDNPSAFKFFPAIGWCHEGIEDGMHRFCREM